MTNPFKGLDQPYKLLTSKTARASGRIPRETVRFLWRLWFVAHNYLRAEAVERMRMRRGAKGYAGRIGAGQSIP